jgi:hypothetical protein
MEYIAYCGLLCDQCPIYIATKNNDEKTKEKLAIEYSNEKCKFTKEDMNCEGCFSVKNKDSKMCGDCEVRNCAEKKNNIENCSCCSDYPCALIDKYSPAECRTRLDQILSDSKKHNQ